MPLRKPANELNFPGTGGPNSGALSQHLYGGGRDTAQGQIDPPRHAPRAYYVEITGIASGSAAGDGNYTADLFLLVAERATSTLTFDAIKGEAVYEDAIFMDSGKSTTQLNEGDIGTGHAFFAGIFDGKLVFVGLGIPFSGCSTGESGGGGDGMGDP